MPAFAPIVINDGATTPVAHTYTPNGVNPKDSTVAQFKESTGTPVGDKTITVSLRAATASRKARVVIALPIMVTETINGVSVSRIDHSNFVEVIGTFSEKSTTQERKDAMALATNLISPSHAVMSKVFQDLEMFW